jgi:two-component system, LuxR family, response regulator FixJ
MTPEASMPEGRVFLVEDDEAVRDAVSLVLRTAGLDVTAYPTAEAFLSAYAPAAAPEVLIVDVRLPKMSGLDLQNRLTRSGCEAPIILITGHGDVPMATQALKAGAFDFIQKPIDDEVLLTSIAQGLQRASDAQTRAARHRDIVRRFGNLTAREREVMNLVVAGAPNKAVAANLGISPRTVEVYRKRVMEKMEARTLPDLVRLAETLRSLETSLT